MGKEVQVGAAGGTCWDSAEPVGPAPMEHLTCGGRLPPSFFQAMVALGAPAALQYSLTVRPSCTWVLSGLTWTLGPLPPADRAL